ncbi:uncharacterized protein smash [Hetaerina americana]|uniref:uncharacterized protein smash n=1 Tax=Hetaerina americana TaxID=62018 RepID=UPI003A7F5018
MPVTAKENMDPPHRKDSTGGGGGGLEFVTTRFPTAATAPRVSVNPLQFVKVAPPKLFVPPAGGLPSAAEREKEEKERRRKLSQAAEEDWQANLDNWKSSRLKRVEHIVERVEEVRRVEQEDSVWSVTGRRKSKTFNEMMEERSTRGVRKTSLGLLGLSYPANDDDGEDVLTFGTSGGDAGSASSKEQQDWGTGSDRGTSATSSLSGLDSGGQVSEAETEKEAPAVKENGTKAEDNNNNNNDRSNNGNEGDNGNHGEGPEEEIYTYERAIQEYVNYTERRNSGGVAVMERKNGEVTATLPDVRNGVTDGPSSPKKQSNGPSTFESVKNSVQSWTVDEEAEDGSGETEEEAEEEVLRRISFKEKLASFRNLENSTMTNLPVSIADVNVPDVKEKSNQMVKSKTEAQEDVVVYHANEDSGIHTGDTSQSEGEGEISTPVCRNTKQELAKTMEPSVETVIKEQKCDGVAKSDSEKKQGGGSTVLPSDVPRKEVTNVSSEPSKSTEETPTHPKPQSKPSLPSTPSTPTKSPAKPLQPQPTKPLGRTESAPIPPVKSPRTPPVPPPRPSHKQTVAAPEVIPTIPSPAQKTPEVTSQESLPTGNVPATAQENTKRTLENFKEDNQTKGQITEPIGSSVNSLPVKSSTTDVNLCKKVVQTTTESPPASPEKTSPQVALVEESSIVSGLQREQVDSIFSDVITKKDDPFPVSASSSPVASQGDAMVVAKHVKESSQDHSSGYSSSETSSSQQSLGGPKAVPLLLSESKMVPPSMGELRGLEALDALLAATPPPSTPLPPILDLTSEDVHVVGGLGFALSTPAKALAPPTEKPPPPPASSPPSTPTGSLTRKSTGSNAGTVIGDFRRRNSTKRIRKEIRRKRSDFLGIDAGHEGSDGDGEDIADDMEAPEMLTIPTSSECTAEEEDEEDGEYGEEDVEQELVRLQQQEPSPTTHCGLDVSSSPLPGETEEEEEEERSSCQTQETDSGVELTEKDREDRRGKKIVEVEEIEERRQARMQGIQGLYEKEVEAKNNVSNQYYGPVVAEPAAALHHQSMQDVRMREVVNEEPVHCTREEPIHSCPPATLRRSLPDFACPDGDGGHPQQINHSEQPPWRRPQPPPVPPHKPRPVPPAEVTSPPKTNMRQAHLRALNVPPKPRIIPTDGWVSPEVRSSHAFEWNGSPQHPLNPTNVPPQMNHPFANSLPRNHTLMQSGAPVMSPERRGSQPGGYPMGSPVKNDGVHPNSVDGMQREERESVPRRKKTDGSGGYNYQHWLIQEAEHRRITEMQDRRRSHNGHSVPARESGVEETVTNGSPSRGKPLPDSIIQTLTQRVQGRTAAMSSPNHRPQEPQHTRSEGRPKSADMSVIHRQLQNSPRHPQQQQQRPTLPGQPPTEKMLSVSGKKKCSHCSQELGRGAAMIIESLRLFYHIGCFRCCVCHAQLGDGLVGADVRVRAGRLHCHHCYSSDDGVKFSCV